MLNSLLIAIQIIIEALPISSSTHVKVAAAMLREAGVSVALWGEAVNVLLHVPSLCVVAAVVWAHRRTITYTPSDRVTLFCYAWVSTGITVAAYYALKKQIIVYSWPCAVGVLLTAVVLRATAWAPQNNKPLGLSLALIIGCAQAIALGPGVSRLGATYAAGRLFGQKPINALLYSLLLQTILMLGAVGRAMVRGEFFGAMATILHPFTLAAIVLATGVAYGALLVTWALVRANRLWLFSYYLIFFSLVVWYLRIA